MVSLVRLFWIVLIYGQPHKHIIGSANPLYKSHCTSMVGNCVIGITVCSRITSPNPGSWAGSSLSSGEIPSVQPGLKVEEGGDGDVSFIFKDLGELWIGWIYYFSNLFTTCLPQVRIFTYQLQQLQACIAGYRWYDESQVAWSVVRWLCQIFGSGLVANPGRYRKYMEPSWTMNIIPLLIG